MRRMWFPILVLLAVCALALFGPAAPAGPDQPAIPAEEAGGEAEAEPEDDRPVESFEPSEKLPADSAVSFPVDI